MESGSRDPRFKQQDNKLGILLDVFAGLWIFAAGLLVGAVIF